MTDGFDSDAALRRLHGQYLLLVAMVAGAVLLGYTTLERWYSTVHATRWAIPVLGIAGYELWLVWNGLVDNHSEGGNIQRTGLGIGNVLTISRGMLIALLSGFLLVSPPTGALRWLPGILYAGSILLDFLDGYLARRTGTTTVLGRTLDVEFDALGLLVAPLLAVRYGQLPLWYLAVGVARYLFVGGIRIRQWRSLPVVPLPPSRVRRVLAVLQMLVVSGSLLPIFQPPLTTVVATVAMIPFLAGFFQDWLAVTRKRG